MNIINLQAEVLNTVEHTAQYSAYNVLIKSGKQAGKNVVARWYLATNTGVDLPHIGDEVKLKVSFSDKDIPLFFLHAYGYNKEFENLTWEDF